MNENLARTYRDSQRELWADNQELKMEIAILQAKTDTFDLACLGLDEEQS